MIKEIFIFSNSFFIFQQEELKVLYHQSKNPSADPVRDVGFCEAIIQFTNKFTSNCNEAEVVNTEKTMQLYYNPEPQFWMILTLNVPFETLDGNKIEYHGEEMHENVYKALIKQYYNSFYLLHGGFGSLGLNREGLCEVLKRHFDKFLQKVDFTAEITNVWGSVQYFPVNQSHFLKIQTFINLVEATFENKIENCVFLYGNQVTWSGLIPENLYPFYSWLQRTVFPKLNLTGLQGDLVHSFQSNQYGTFIFGPRTLNCIMPVRKIYFKEYGVNRCYDLCVYRVLNCILCIFMTADNEPENFYEELSSIAGPQMTTISTELAEFQATINKQQQQETNEPNFKYLFFNELTLKHEGSIRASTIPLDVMNIINDLYRDRTDASVGEETIVKTHNDYWIIRKSSNYRHYFLVLNKTASTLIDVARDARKITDQHIRSIFFDKQNETD